MTNDFENDSNGRDSEHDPDKDNSIEDFIEMLEKKRKTPQVRIVDPKRMQELKAAYRTLEDIVQQADPHAVVTCGVSELGLGVIEIETDALLVRNAGEFAKAVETANNFEIYPSHFGRLKMAVKFHNCLKELT